MMGECHLQDSAAERFQPPPSAGVETSLAPQVTSSSRPPDPVVPALEAWVVKWRHTLA